MLDALETKLGLAAGHAAARDHGRDDAVASSTPTARVALPRCIAAAARPRAARRTSAPTTTPRAATSPPRTSTCAPGVRLRQARDAGRARRHRRQALRRRDQHHSPDRRPRRPIARAPWRLHVRPRPPLARDGFYQGWDLHPAQLPTRYGAVYAFFLDGLDAAATSGSRTSSTRRRRRRSSATCSTTPRPGRACSTTSCAASPAARSPRTRRSAHRAHARGLPGQELPRDPEAAPRDEWKIVEIWSPRGEWIGLVTQPFASHDRLEQRVVRKCRGRQAQERVRDRIDLATIRAEPCQPMSSSQP